VELGQNYGAKRLFMAHIIKVRTGSGPFLAGNKADISLGLLK
jgi:hypothetical protein